MPRLYLIAGIEAGAVDLRGKSDIISADNHKSKGRHYEIKSIF